MLKTMDKSKSMNKTTKLNNPPLSPNVSILELIEDDFKERAETVYQETVILDQQITSDDFSKKEMIDELLLEIADPFFYGSIVSSIGKIYHFLPVKVTETAYLLKECEPKEAKFMIRFYRTTMDIEIQAFSDWRTVKKDEKVAFPRYFGVNKKKHKTGKDQRLCFIIIDFINKTTS